ncbi:Integral membrane protein [Prescottella defluvii]|uniref:hypothetical protein n=1 Tax=Prescottella defluvii TaxID=1323361 RepID=UPI0004F3E831|nr:hypothetical protein [Prescottella defluvii]
MERSDRDGLDWNERGLRMVRDVDAGQWIVDRVHGFDHTVASLLPPNFAAYARIFHPAATAGGRSVRWAEVAAANGTTVHPVMEWGSIVGTWDAPGQPGVWDDEPSQGSLPPPTARTLTTILGRFTGTPETCWFGHWEGSGEVSAPSDHRRLLMPARDMVLFTGTLDMADTQFGATREFPAGTSAHLWWPDDHAWCVATDIDLMSTYLGASEACVAAVLAEEELEALPAHADQSLTWDSDTVNPLPPEPDS